MINPGKTKGGQIDRASLICDINISLVHGGHFWNDGTTRSKEKCEKEKNAYRLWV